MNSQPYNQLSDGDLLALCIWREARGEGPVGKLAVGCVIRNRVAAQTFFGHTLQSVILRPYQFSSFNENDPNADKWPEDGEADWLDCQDAALDVASGSPDPSNNALYYFSPPLTAPPREWGLVTQTASVGRLKFYKPAPTQAPGLETDIS